MLCSSNLSGKLQQTFSLLPTADLPSAEGLPEAPSRVQPIRACGERTGSVQGSFGKQGRFLCLLETRAILPLTSLQNAYRRNVVKAGRRPNAAVMGITRG